LYAHMNNKRKMKKKKNKKNKGSSSFLRWDTEMTLEFIGLTQIREF
jgi:hypothetical protein